MKLYVLPVESACNAACPFCITDFRQTAKKEFLDLDSLDNALRSHTFERIEITGGGEPLLHSDIDSIVRICADAAPTHLYTNGILLAEKAEAVQALQHVVVSRAHYYDVRNFELMRLRHKYDWKKTLEAVQVPVKASLILLKQGIHDAEGFKHYADWLKDSGVHALVVRQLFNHDDNTYAGVRQDDYVATATLLQDFTRAAHFQLDARGLNPVITYNNLAIEFEVRSCACEMHNPVLHADGSLHKGWTDELYEGQP